MPRTVTSRAVRSYRTLSPLPDPACAGHRRFALCCTGRRLAPPRRYLAPCPVKPGLSSPGTVASAGGDCLADSGRGFYTITPGLSQRYSARLTVIQNQRLLAQQSSAQITHHHTRIISALFSTAGCHSEPAQKPDPTTQHSAGGASRYGQCASGQYPVASPAHGAWARR